MQCRHIEKRPFSVNTKKQACSSQCRSNQQSVSPSEQQHTILFYCPEYYSSKLTSFVDSVRSECDAINKQQNYIISPTICTSCREIIIKAKLLELFAMLVHFRLHALIGTKSTEKGEKLNSRCRYSLSNVLCNTYT